MKVEDIHTAHIKTQEYLHEGDGGSDEGAGAIALPTSWPRPELQDTSGKGDRLGANFGGPIGGELVGLGSEAGEELGGTVR